MRSFLAMARQRKTQPRPVDALQLLAYGMRAAGIEVEQAIAPGVPPVFCDPDQMTQVLANLLLNAQQALEGEPQPRPVRINAAADGEMVAIEVADNGPGIPVDLRSRVFDPFFTTKPAGAGTGIGLAVSRGIVEAHGGSLTLAATDRGACFVLRLPQNDPGEAVAESAAASEPPPAIAERVALVVDDEMDVGLVLSEMLAAQGMRCKVVTSGEAAVECLKQQDYDLIITDMRLRARALRLDRPAPPSVVRAHGLRHRRHAGLGLGAVSRRCAAAIAGEAILAVGRPAADR